MKERKFVCPKCGADVVCWDEMIHDNIRKIHPISGMVYKHIDRTPEQEVGHAGVKCTDCDWFENLITTVGSDDKWKDLALTNNNKSSFYKEEKVCRTLITR